MLFLTRAMAPRMAARGGGVVVNLASLHAFLARRDHVVYAATKGAIVAATRVLAVELAPQRIRVHAIAPGTCSDQDQAHGGSFPAGRVSRPEEIGRLVAFLAGDDGVHFTGQCLRYDGGWSAMFPAVEDFREPATAPWGERYL
jgi:NAD(P)-dependent dehydrogenase (short-subunit alcohol dehydrogenase family)